MYHDNPTLQSRPAATALPFGAAVKLSAGKFALAGAADIALGVTTRAVEADETVQPRRPSAGSLVVLAAGSINPGDQVVAAADGKAQALPVAAGTYIRRGIAVGTAAADGDWVEIEPQRWGEPVTVAG